MSTPQPTPQTDSYFSVLGEDTERATELAKAMTAHPIAAHGTGRPWTVQEVLGVALGLGLEDLEKRYSRVTESAPCEQPEAHDFGLTEDDWDSSPPLCNVADHHARATER